MIKISIKIHIRVIITNTTAESEILIGTGSILSIQFPGAFSPSLDNFLLTGWYARLSRG